MSMPHPIVRVEIGPSHDSLIKRLGELGMNVEGISRADRPYVCLIKFGTRIELSYADEEEIAKHPLATDSKYWGTPMILLNSPAQMIRYTMRLLESRS
jgi:hypothetical protein